MAQEGNKVDMFRMRVGGTREEKGRICRENKEQNSCNPQGS